MSQPPSISVTVTTDIRNRLTVKTQLQGMLMSAIEQMAHDRRIRVEDCIKEILEQRLVKDGYLPEWWFTRGKGIQ